MTEYRSHYQAKPDNIDPDPVCRHDEEVLERCLVGEEVDKRRPVGLVGLVVLDGCRQRRYHHVDFIFGQLLSKV